MDAEIEIKTSESTSENHIDEDSKQAENVDNTVVQQQKPRPAKSKKRKKPRDSTAPKHPLTGYVRYLNDRREAVRSSYPNLPFQEITKMLASEWTSLPADKKKSYLDAAEIDRERYTREYNTYKQTDAYKQMTNEQNAKKQKAIVEAGNKQHASVLVTAIIPQSDSHVNNQTVQVNDFSTSNNFDIPIFTEEFLDHNKARDTELRQLRKSNTDYEQQNAMLTKHIESMKGAIEKLEAEIVVQKKTNNSLQSHLERLRGTLTNGFSSVKIPGVKEMATRQTIDSYMNNLHSMLLQDKSHDSNLYRTVREVVGQLEFTG